MGIAVIRILLADDHRLMREGLRSLLEEQPDMRIVGEAENGKLAVQLAAKLMPDIIIMDISMPGLNGIDATCQILSNCTKSKVIALSMHTERRTVLEMLNAGASGYLLKDCAFEEVIQAVRTVASNNTYLSPKITEIVIKDYVHRIPKSELSSLSGLTTREREVLQLLSEGKKTKEIADLLRVSIKTAESYRQQIMEKLNIHSIAELTKLAIREGITSL
jgi:DNA-binding NarL/FixJ family response regulator